MIDLEYTEARARAYLDRNPDGGSALWLADDVVRLVAEVRRLRGGIVVIDDPYRPPTKADRDASVRAFADIQTRVPGAIRVTRGLWRDDDGGGR